MLKCSDDSFYIGQTEDVPRRLKEQAAGEVSWTSKHLPFEIIHWEELDSREIAVKREQDLKTGFGRKWLKREYEAGRLAARQAGGAKPIAYLWARTLCESPNCGAEIPLMRSFWLCKKANRRRALQPKVVRPKGETPRVEFEIFTPKSESEVAGGTVSRAKAACVCCGMVLPPERVRAQLAAQRGGADVIFDEAGRRIGGARLLAVVTLKEGEAGRQYRLPTEQYYEAVRKAMERLGKVAAEKLPDGLSPVPDEPTPAGGGSGAGRAFSVQKYGMMKFGDLFTARQKLALVTLAIESQGRIVGEAAALSLALAIGRCAEQMSSLVRWRTTVEAVAGTFGRQALPMMWDFVEIVPTGDGGSNFGAALDWVSEVVEEQGPLVRLSGQVEQADACASPLPDDASGVWFTDPPYYDAVPYADLSDFFFVWLKRTLPQHPLLRDPFDPQNPLRRRQGKLFRMRSSGFDGRAKDRAFFEETMASAFAEGRRVLRDEGLGCVVFAHKTTEGWEALLSGLIRGGWVITGSWPIATDVLVGFGLKSQPLWLPAFTLFAGLGPKIGSATGAKCCGNSRLASEIGWSDCNPRVFEGQT